MFRMSCCHTRSSHPLNSYLSVAPKLFFFPSRFLIWRFPLFSSNRHRDLTPAHMTTWRPDTCNAMTQPKVDPLLNGNVNVWAFGHFAAVVWCANTSTQPAAPAPADERVGDSEGLCIIQGMRGSCCCWNAPQGQRNNKLEWSWVCAQTHTWASLKFIGWLFPDEAVKKKKKPKPKQDFYRCLFFSSFKLSN